MTSATILRVALDTPVRRLFDYLPPAPGKQPAAALGAPLPSGSPVAGQRVAVPFGRQRLVGVIVATDTRSDVPAEKLRHAHELLDAQPVFDAPLLDLLRWASDYYHHPLGEVAAAAPAAPGPARCAHRGAAGVVDAVGGRCGCAGRGRAPPRPAPAQPARATRAGRRRRRDAERGAAGLARCGTRAGATRLDRVVRATGAGCNDRRDGRAHRGRHRRLGARTLGGAASRGRCGDRRRRGSVPRLPSARHHRQRQDRGLPAAGGARPRPRPPHARARAGDRAHAAARVALRHALRERAARRSAFGPDRRAAPRRLARGHHGPRAPRARHALGRVRAGARSRPDRDRRGTRRLVQAAGRRVPLFRARPRNRACAGTRHPDRARLGDAGAGIAAQRGDEALRAAVAAAPYRACAAADAAADRPAAGARARGALDHRGHAHAAASGGRWPGAGLHQPPRLRADTAVRGLRLDRALRRLRRAHDRASRRRSACAAITAAPTGRCRASARNAASR